MMSKEKQGLWPEINYLGRMHGKGMQVHWTWVHWVLIYCVFFFIIISFIVIISLTFATLLPLPLALTLSSLLPTCFTSFILLFFLTTCHLHHLYHNQHHLNPQHCSVVFFSIPILYLNCCISPMKFRMELNSPPGSRRWHWFQQVNKHNVTLMTAIICYCIYRLRMD